MENIKTAISLQKCLFDQVDALARELKISSSSLFVLAAEEFIQQHKKNKELLEDINTAYNDFPDQQEQNLLKNMRFKHRQLVEGQW